MPNNYYERLSEMNPGEIADGLAMEQEFDAIGRGFAKLPEPHRDGQGFEGPTRVGDPIERTDAVNLGTLEKLNLPIYRKKITTEDWNSITDAGIYDVVNASGANKAPGHPYGVLKVYKFNGVATQEYSPDQNQQGILQKRVCVDTSANSWGAWDGALPMSHVSAYVKTILDDQTAADVRSTLLLGSSATRNVGVGSGNVMEVGAFGLGSEAVPPGTVIDQANNPTGFYHTADIISSLGTYMSVVHVGYRGSGYAAQIGIQQGGSRVKVVARSVGSQAGVWLPTVELRHTGNTTVDSNGFIKNASPIMRLHGTDDDTIAYLYRDEDWVRSGVGLVNSEAVGAVAKRISTGHYKITGCHGFAREGWYIETPNDANGNKILFVKYLQGDDGSIDIWTSSPDYSSGRCTEGKPIDIPYGRWIDLRLCMDNRDIGPNFS